ncbi:hypothetical protein BKA70DRAFT_1436854 [Coprinopsis sp. MPI-PUGE-AT-0042]|nr:hypothetical protein BKA70DRAFT_1436854 [Coprinopsis sp. MPI-PUGE-AT-0042]
MTITVIYKKTFALIEEEPQIASARLQGVTLIVPKLLQAQMALLSTTFIPYSTSVCLCLTMLASATSAPNLCLTLLDSARLCSTLLTSAHVLCLPLLGSARLV